MAKEVLSKKIQEFNTEPAESGFELKTQRMDESAILVKKKKNQASVTNHMRLPRDCIKDKAVIFKNIVISSGSFSYQNLKFSYKHIVPHLQ